ncbi:unnamed protein product [Rotaria sordida]|uniref:Uncharacterized protein n=1 Tax=Rotaria sordida TaxID=392033 RepID=A0A814LSV2_9BILA|nr:unnamed protein product [Rotaria sordida]
MTHQPLDNSSTSSTTFQSRKKFSLHYVLPKFDKAFQEAVRDPSIANFGECLVLEKEQSEESLMQLCQQVESIYVLINTTNNNDSPVKIEMDILYVHHQCII